MQWPHAIQITVRWRDLDGAGHVNNANYFSYFEAVRADAYYRASGIDPRQGAIRDLDIILARTSCDYRSPARLGEELRVSCWPAKVGETSFILRYDIREATTQRLIAEGESIQVCYDYEREQKKPIPPRVRSALLQGLASENH